MAVVKSNAYGHGLVQITEIVSSKSKNIWFGVDNLDEARVVRNIAPKNPVLVLGYTQNARLKEATLLGAQLTIYNWETLKALQNLRLHATHYRFQVHVKIETGTTRQGISEDETVEYIKKLKKIKRIEVAGISTHFANIEDTGNHTYAEHQLTRYNSVIERLKRAGISIPAHHTACTAATLLFPKIYGNLVRVGIGLYGLWPSSQVRELSNGNGIDFKPVLTWKTIVAQIKHTKKGTPVSYGLTERVECNSMIAVLPVGYWNGYDRGLSRIGYVLINGKRCKVLGRICMNMMMVDITNAGNVHPEGEVVLLGYQGKGSGDKLTTQEVSADELAEKLNTINYEIVTRINPLIPRIIV